VDIRKCFFEAGLFLREIGSLELTVKKQKILFLTHRKHFPVMENTCVISIGSEGS
jgi:hypothetical protein